MYAIELYGEKIYLRRTWDDIDARIENLDLLDDTYNIRLMQFKCKTEFSRQCLQYVHVPDEGW